MTPRRKQFDPDRALDDAMELFWERGYEAASVQELVDRMGINRFSLYDTFGDKQQLFTSACERYRRLMEEERIHELESARSGLQGITDFFHSLENYYASGKGAWGCLMTNSIVENAPHDEELLQLGCTFLQRLEDAFVAALTNARESGEIDSDETPRDLAQYLVCVVQGLAVVGKTSPSRRRIHTVIRQALSVLE